MSIADREPPDPSPVSVDKALDQLASADRRLGTGTLALLIWLGRLAQKNDLNMAAIQGDLDFADWPLVFDRYKLEGLLGAGGHGAVFRAHDFRLARQVALKLAWPGVLLDPDASRRFVEEPRLVAALRHRGIVEVYDSGDAEMICFIALELIDGPTLGAWIYEQGRVAVRQAVEIVRDIADSLRFAHERDIVHRDLKPSNILLRPSTQLGGLGFETVVTDFGSARGPRLADASKRTLTFAILGTDQYMSPEQASGDAGSVGAQSDVFSLGVILYELLAGRLPFEGLTPEQTRHLIRCDEPAPLGRAGGEIARDLWTVVFKCLEKSPSDRYANAGELADDLTRIMCYEPIRARRSSFANHAWKYARRRPMSVALGTTVLIGVLMIAGLAGAWVADRMASADRIAAAEAAAAVAERIERQHNYAASIRQAADAMARSGRREVLDLLEQCRLLAAPDQCGIEWDYLWARMNDFDRTLKVGSKSVHSVRFSPRGDLLVSAHEDGRVIVWDTSTWTKQAEYDDNIGEARVAEASSDGSMVALGGTDGRIVIHRIADGSIAFDEPIVQGRVFDLKWLGPTAQLAVGGEDARLSIVNVVTGECRSTAQLTALHPDKSHPVEIDILEYLPEHDAVAVGMEPSGTHILNVRTLEPMTSIAGDFPRTGKFCYVPLDCGYFATSLSDSIVQLRSIKDGSVKVEFPERDLLRSLRYSRSAGIIVAAFQNGTVKTWDAKGILTDQSIDSRLFFAHSGRTTAADLSPDSAWLASGGQDGCIRLWHRALTRDPFNVALIAQPYGIQFSHCGRWFAIASGIKDAPRQITIFDVRSGEPVWTVDNANAGPSQHSDWHWRQGAFSPSGQEFVYLDTNFNLQVCESQTGKRLNVISQPSDSENGIAVVRFSPDGKLLLTRQLGDMTVLDQSSGAVVDRMSAPWQKPSPIYYDKLRTMRGDLWLVSDLARNLQLMPSPSSAPALTLKDGPTERILTWAISPGGRFVAVGAADSVVYFWDLTKDGPPSKCVGHKGWIDNLCFSPDQATLISHGRDGTVRFWHVPTRAELLTLGSSEQPIHCIGLSPTGHVLMLGVQNKDRYGLQVHNLGSNGNR